MQRMLKQLFTVSNVPISPAPASSSNMGSSNGSLPDLDGTGNRACTTEENINEIYWQLPLFIQDAAKIENCVQTLAQTVAALTTKITKVNNLLEALWLASLLWKQVQLLVPVVLIQQDLGTCLDSNCSTATGSLGSQGPGSSDDNRNTRRGLDTFTSPEDEHARSAILFRFPCEQYHTGITNWINNL